MAAARRIKVADCVHGTEAARVVIFTAVKRRRKVVKVDCAISTEATSYAKHLDAARRMREEAFVSLTVVRSAAVSQGAKFRASKGLVQETWRFTRMQSFFVYQKIFQTRLLSQPFKSHGKPHTVYK